MGIVHEKAYDDNDYTPVNQFKFHDLFEEEDTTNGLVFNGVFLPQEIVFNILRLVPPREILRLSLVCKKWCNIIKSSSLWIEIYNSYYPNSAKNLPWYVFYCYFTTDSFNNLLKNGNGEKRFEDWTIRHNGGNEFKIEDPPAGADPLPVGVPEFNGHTSCFATSYQWCSKFQIISFDNKRLLKYIVNEFSPALYVSEWVTGRFDCACKYQMSISAFSASNTLTMPLFSHDRNFEVEQWQGGKWQKIEIVVGQNYMKSVGEVFHLEFFHRGKDTQFWAGHYGPKMAGGVVKFQFESIKPKINQ